MTEDSLWFFKNTNEWLSKTTMFSARFYS